MAIGGDGTAIDVASGLLAAERSAPMAFVPCGTANVLALNLGIPTALDAAVTTAVEGVETRVDVGELRAAGASEPFLLSVGTGLHAGIVERAGRALKRRVGSLAYVWAGWRELGGTPLLPHRITIDDEELEVEASMVQVMNMGSVFRRSWSLGPDVTPVDGLLDLLAYRTPTAVGYLRVAARVLQGAPTATDLVLHHRARRVRIEAEPPAKVQRDGELAGETPIELEVRPAALAVVVPSGSPWAA